MSDIRAIVKRPGEKTGHIAVIENDLEMLQGLVGGYIEAVTMQVKGKPMAIICNEEGRLRGLPYNCSINGVDFVGAIVIVGVDGDEFADIPPIDDIRDSLGPII